MSGQSGKGNSSAQTTQQATNQQVAAQSGIALGAGSHGNEINISSSDPEVSKYALGTSVAQSQVALGANAHVTDSALNFAGHAAEVAAGTNNLALSAVQSIAGGSILAQNDLATKFGENTSKLAAQNIGLLQSVGQELTTVSLASLENNKSALDSAFGVAAQVAPQTDNFTATALGTTLSKTVLYIGLAVAAIFGLFFFSRKKS